jgi:alkylhydroperoxidase/carboxymuconolactone decarboxylase family protein YurZ
MRGVARASSNEVVTPEEEELLRRLAMHDEAAVLSAVLGGSGLEGLDRKTCMLVRLAALISVESSVASYQSVIEIAIAQGATEEEIIDVLLAVAPVVGSARLTSAAPQLALALGYDVDQAGL